MHIVNSRFTAGILLLQLFGIIGCSKSNNNNNNNPPANVTGAYIVSGIPNTITQTTGSISYTGTCTKSTNATTGGVNVKIDAGGGDSIIFYNVPIAASGTFPLTDPSMTTTYQNTLYATWFLNDASGKVIIQGPPLPNPNNIAFYPASGSLIKTSANSFTFSMSMYIAALGAFFFNVNGTSNY